MNNHVQLYMVAKHQWLTLSHAIEMCCSATYAIDSIFSVSIYGYAVESVVCLHL